MRHTRLLILRLLFSLAVLGGGLWWALGHPSDQANHLRLKSALTGVEASTVTLESTVPFEWDTLYAFAPGVTREKMSEITGADCSSVPEAEEGGGDRLVFLLGGEVVCAVSGDPAELGYQLNLPEERPAYSAVTYGERVAFIAHRKDGIVTLNPKASTEPNSSA